MHPSNHSKLSLTEILCSGTRQLIAQTVEAKLQAILEQHAHHQLLDGRHAVVRNGYLPERTIQTGIGDTPIKVPKVAIAVAQVFVSIANCCLRI